MRFLRKLFNFTAKQSNEEDADMKFLIAGLGNPGAEYAGTRHNIGFMVLDHMAEKKELLFNSDRYGSTVTLRHRGKQLILLKPMTYMNLSGKAIRYHLQQNKLTPDRLLVITDDLALPFGTLRMKPKGSSGGHNGLTNIEEVLGTREYPRLRFGIGSEFSKGGQVDYVLSDFDSEEKEKLPKLIEKARNMTLSFTVEGIQQAMSKFNG